MGKAEELTKAMGGMVGESIGVGRGEGPMFRDVPGQGMPDRMKGVARSKGALDIPIGRIIPDPDQPREEFEPGALERLAASIQSRGVLQSIRVRWVESAGAYMIIMGERRFRASMMAGLATIPCIVMDGEISEGELLGLQLVENLLREDLRPIEQARAYRQLMDANGWSVSQLARELAIDQGGASRALALLDLPEPVRGAVDRGELGPTLAYEVSKLDDAEAQADVAERAVSEGMSRAEVVEEVRRAASRLNKAAKGRGAKAKAKRTSATIRTSNGYRLTADHRRGIDDDGLLAALIEAADQIRARQEGKAEAA